MSRGRHGRARDHIGAGARRGRFPIVQATSPARVTPQVTFDRDRTLTSFAELMLFQALFAVVGFRGCLRACFEHLDRAGDPLALGSGMGEGEALRVIGRRAPRSPGHEARFRLT